jgi:multiple sugar transport system permease protein
MQEYLYAVAYVAPRSEKVVTVGLATALIRSDIFFWGSLMAGRWSWACPPRLYSLVLDRFPPGPV